MSQRSSQVPELTSHEPSGWDGCGCGSGYAVLILSPLIGVALALLQDANISNAWAYCSGLAPEVANDIANTGQDWLGALALRVICYSLCLPVGVAIGWRICHTRTLIVKVTVGCVLGVVICALAFWGDYAFNNGMTHGFYLPSMCPGGRPPWWPAWLSLRITGHCVGELCNGH